MLESSFSLKSINNKAFTIIEVVLVLAVASLIILMVLFAIPKLRESQRNNERQTEVAGMAAGLVQYISQNRGQVPSVGDWGSATSTFSDNFWGEYVDSGNRETDPSNGLYRDIADASTPGHIDYQPGQACLGLTDFEDSIDQYGFAMRVTLEGGGYYCADSE